MTPNQATFLSLVWGLGGAVGFLQGTRAGWIMGAVGLEISYLLDNCDGELARATGRVSSFGSRFDFLADCVIHAACFLALAAGFSRLETGFPWIVVGQATAAAVVLTYLTFFMEQLRQRGQEAWRHPDPPGGCPQNNLGQKLRKTAREDFSLVVLASALLGHLQWILAASLCGALVYTLLNLFSMIKGGVPLRCSA